ncbi:hypothetical protein Tsubulata_046911 [Turnera subulata]|uniref:Protein NIM1-INTERACTING 2 n=1 Tax=Turnera subulata TaxID=218843 RepID=A0A9Q0IXA6_9ROSI|nr:hypothetical protein Tsubulata_046911 [Turnera subulata]
MSEGEKRKQDNNYKNGDDASATHQKKQRKDQEGEQTTVTDTEVDEFYAILKRLHVAVKYFKEGNGRDGRKLTEIESVGLERDVVGDGVKRNREDVDQNMALDLNADPEPE